MANGGVSSGAALTSGDAAPTRGSGRGHSSSSSSAGVSGGSGKATKGWTLFSVVVVLYAFATITAGLLRLSQVRTGLHVKRQTAMVAALTEPFSPELGNTVMAVIAVAVGGVSVAVLKRSSLASKVLVWTLVLHALLWVWVPYDATEPIGIPAACTRDAIASAPDAVPWSCREDRGVIYRVAHPGLAYALDVGFGVGLGLTTLSLVFATLDAFTPHQLSPAFRLLHKRMPAPALIGPVLLFFTPLVMTVDLFVVGLAGVLYLALAHEMDDGDVTAAFQAQ